MRIAAFIVTAGASAAALGAPTAGFVEDFNAGDADWRDASSGAVTYNAAGALDGSGFISGNIADVFALNPTFGGVALRAEDAFDSSADAFVGDYISAGIDTVTIDIRHDGGDDLAFFVRAANPGNSPAAVFGAPVLVSSGQWTTVSFAISETSPFYIPAGAPSPTFFQDVMSNVANFQIGVLPGGAYAGNASVTFDLDNVRLVPSPSGAALLALGGLIAARRRR